MVDPIFAERRLAQIYDPLDPDRSDLDAYVALADEFGARSVLDIGCGTGTFPCLLADRGLAVTAVDPAAASLELARHLDAMIDSQDGDGGWRPNFPMWTPLVAHEWGGYLTLMRLKILRAYDRIG